MGRPKSGCFSLTLSTLGSIAGCNSICSMALSLSVPGWIVSTSAGSPQTLSSDNSYVSFCPSLLGVVVFLSSVVANLWIAFPPFLSLLSSFITYVTNFHYEITSAFQSSLFPGWTLSSKKIIYN